MSKRVKTETETPTSTRAPTPLPAPPAKSKTLLLVFVQEDQYEFARHAWMASSEDLTDEMRQWLRAASENNYDCLDADVRGFMSHPNWDDDETGDQFDEPEDRRDFVRGRTLADRVFPAEGRCVLDGDPVEVGPGEYIEHVYTVAFSFF